MVTQRRNGCIANYDLALLTSMHIHLLKIPSLCWEAEEEGIDDFCEHKQGGVPSRVLRQDRHIYILTSARTWDTLLWSFADWTLVMAHNPAHDLFSIGNFLCRVTPIRPNSFVVWVTACNYSDSSVINRVWTYDLKMIYVDLKDWMRTHVISSESENPVPRRG